jgi:exonuclease SbcD
LRIILTDEEDIIGALQSLRAIYPNIMRLDYDNERTRASAILPDMGESDMRTPLEIFSGFYESQNGKSMDEDQMDLVSGLIEKVWGDEL